MVFGFIRLLLFVAGANSHDTNKAKTMSTAGNKKCENMLLRILAEMTLYCFFYFLESVKKSLRDELLF